jgi:hypothetical protein
VLFSHAVSDPGVAAVRHGETGVAADGGRALGGVSFAGVGGRALRRTIDPGVAPSAAAFPRPGAPLSSAAIAG